MKKYRFALLLLTGLLACTAAAPVSAAMTAADTEDISPYRPANAAGFATTYNLIDQTVYEGTWLETGYGFDLYLPKDWKTITITDELAADGLVFGLTDPEEKWGFSLFRTPAEQLDGATIESLYEQLSAAPETYANCSYETVNDIHVLVYDNLAENSAGILFFDADSNLYSIIFTPADDVDFVPYRRNLFLSITATQLIEVESETESLTAEP
ncbi:MAG: hypothetical protein Q4B09_02675 [Lachnospiraceae bacterium]|nr:hypothetical protein [Lachnospiraceae bacterium]